MNWHKLLFPDEHRARLDLESEIVRVYSKLNDHARTALPSLVAEVRRLQVFERRIESMR